MELGTHEEEQRPLSDVAQQALFDVEVHSDEEAAATAEPKERWWPSRRTAAALGVASLLALAATASLLPRRQAEEPAAVVEHAEQLDEIFLTPGTRAKLRGLDISFDPYGQVNTAHLGAEAGEEVQSVVGWPPEPLQHAGENCWHQCGQASGDCLWCGKGNACCRQGSTRDPPECRGATFSTALHHTCVTPVSALPVKHQGQDCWAPCKGSGYCEWCGAGNACCRKGFGSSDAPECSGAVGFPTADRHTCVVTIGSCPLGQVKDKSGKCVKPTSPPLLSFYMYRSMNEENYPITEGVNMASLGGALWYLHNEVVISCPRKFGITRIRRYKVTMRATHALYSATRGNFDLFVAFDRAQCTVPDCAKIHWDKYGFVVGCIPNDPNIANYRDPVWYSLPGICPSKDYTHKDTTCKLSEPGGMCRHPNGNRDCTWWAEEAGEIRVDDLEGITNYNAFCSSGNLEYDVLSDRGRGSSFWDQKHDLARNEARMERVRDLFAKKYPNLPRGLGEPACDAR